MNIKTITDFFKRKTYSPRIITMGREGEGNPFDNILDAYKVGVINYKLYDALREIPIFDAAVDVYNTLIGDFEIESEDKAVLEALGEFRENVSVNYIQKGLHEWRRQYFDTMLTFGKVYGEILPSLNLSSGIEGLFNYCSDKIKTKVEKGKPKLYQLKMMKWEEIPNPNWNLIPFSLNQARDGDLEGRSLFASLPFVAKTFVRILDCINKVYFRIGDPSWLVIVKGNIKSRYEDLKAADTALQTQWGNVFKDRKLLGTVSDVTGSLPPGADLIIEMLGKEGATVVSEKVPIAVIQDEVAAGVKLPLFLLNVHSESNTYKLTTHQADMITARIRYYRRLFDPVLKNILSLQLVFSGLTKGKFIHHWKSITLMDEVEHARAENLRRQAQKHFVDNLIKLQEHNIINPDDFFQNVIDAGIISVQKAAQMGTVEMVEYFKTKLQYNTVVNILEKEKNGELIIE